MVHRAPGELLGEVSACGNRLWLLLDYLCNVVRQLIVDAEVLRKIILVIFETIRQLFILQQASKRSSTKVSSFCVGEALPNRAFTN